MYNFNLLSNENIKIISDNSKVYINNTFKECTTIITNLRLLILDYPSNISNSMEDLRTSQRINYIKKKEIIFELKLKNIINIETKNEEIKIFLSKTTHITIKDKSILHYLKSSLSNENKN